jgi:hypothetical protein
MKTRSLAMASLLLLSAALAACAMDDEDGDGPDGDEVGQIVRDPSGSDAFRVLSASDVDESAELLAMLPASRMTLVVGIEQAAASDGLAISGKFELADEGEGPISLSVYTARAGKETIPEENELVELFGDPTGSTWSPEAEVFEDREHIARASQHLTLMQITSASLESAVRAAGELGTVYAIYPTIFGGQPVFDVRVAGENRTASQVRLALDPI